MGRKSSTPKDTVALAVKSLYDGWRSDQSERIDDYDAYLSFYEAKDTSAPNDPFINEFTSAAEDVFCEIEAMIFGVKHWAKARADNGERNDEADVADGFLDDAFDRVRFRSLVKRNIRHFVALGKTTGAIGTKSSPASRIGFPDFRTVDPRLFASDPDANTIEESPWCVECSWIDEFALEKLQKVKFYDAKEISSIVRDFRKGSISANWKQVDDDKHKAPQSGSKIMRLDFAGNLRTADNKVERDKIITVVAGQQIRNVAIKNIYRHGKKPYVGARILTLDDSSEGIGMGDLGADQLRRINTLTDAQVRLVRMALKNMWIRSRMAKIKDSELDAKEGQIITTLGDVRSSIVPITPAVGVLPYADRITSGAYDNFRRMVGSSLPSQGTPMEPTLGQSQIAIRKGSARSYQAAQAFSEEFLEPLCEMVWSNAQRYVPKDKFFKLRSTGAIASGKTPSAILSDFDFRVEIGPERVSPDYEFQKTALMFDMGLKFNAVGNSQRKADVAKLYENAARISGMNVRDVFTDVDKDHGPAIENMILAQGEEVDVKDGENHIQHNKSHAAFAEKNKAALDPQAQEMFAKHIEAHNAKIMQAASRPPAVAPMGARPPILPPGGQAAPPPIAEIPPPPPGEMQPGIGEAGQGGVAQ